MNITKIPALKCPFCGSSRVTMNREIISCVDCKKTTRYKKPIQEESEDDQEDGADIVKR